MEIKQFEDKNLSHYSYAITSGKEMALIDPSRDPAPYLELANEKGVGIVAIIETHPHADFVSGHLELAKKTGARIYVSAKVGGSYDHQAFDEADGIDLGQVKLVSMNTPGHSPDSITILLKDQQGTDVALFTGDTLFIGDCGRPDLRENVGNIQEQREVQAGHMYESLKRFLVFPDHVLVYPAHGGGSLCGKGLSSQTVSTIGLEKIGNWSLQPMKKESFVKALTEGQPYIPKYFGYDVEMNRKGAPDFAPSVSNWRRITDLQSINRAYPVIDARTSAHFNEGHLEGAISIPDAKQFETWLGSIVSPDERFYLVGESDSHLQVLVERIAKIGYEQLFEGGIHTVGFKEKSNEDLLLASFEKDPSQYSIVDVRNADEARELVFPMALNIPLHQLRERMNEIPEDKEVVVHCAGGYRSGIGRSIIQSVKHFPVYDLGEAIRTFDQKNQLLAGVGK